MAKCEELAVTLFPLFTRTPFGNLCQVPNIGFSADITDPLFIDDTDAGSITARNPLRKIDWFLLLCRVSTPAAEVTLLRDFSSAVLTGDRRNHFTTMGAFHLFLLKMEILDEPFDIPLFRFTAKEAFGSLHLERDD
jgi:hypothetical protein